MCFTKGVVAALYRQTNHNHSSTRYLNHTPAFNAIDDAPHQV